jgi:hypothetical protein
VSTRLAWLALASCAAAVLVTARVLTPSAAGHGTHLALGLPPCGFLTWTGLACPTCGLTTAFALLARGELVPAIRVHPMGVPLFLSCLGVLGLGLRAAVRKAPRLHFPPLQRWALLMVLALLTTWLAKLASAVALDLVTPREVELLQLADQVAPAHA